VAKIKFDLTDQDPEEASRTALTELAPKGIYPAQITKIDAEEPEGKDKRLHVVVSITKPAMTYPPMHEYINLVSKAAAWKFDQLLQAFKLASKTKRTGEFDTDKLAGKNLTILVTHQTDVYEGETRTRARVGSFLPAGKGVTISANGEEPAGEEEPSWSDLGELADEGDEEAATQLREAAEALDIDPDEINTWVEVAGLIEAAEGPEEEAEEEEAEAEEESEEEDDLDALGAAADEEDEAAAARLAEIIEELELEIDPDEYETWVEVAAAIAESTTEEEEEAQDYEAMTNLALKKLAKDRGIPATGTKDELVARHQEYDETDPFKE
jgi:hypothetical protein